MSKLNFKSAKNILSSRSILSKGVMANVPVNNVSFTNPNTGQPFQDDNWDDGKPYAIANFNALSPYRKAEAMKAFKEGNYDEACKSTESMRVTPKQGRALQEAQFASIVVAPRTFTPKDSDEEVTTLSIKKATAIAPLDASESKAFTADDFAGVEAPAETEGAPTTTGA